MEKHLDLVTQSYETTRYSRRLRLLLQQHYYSEFFLICKKFGISQILAMWEFNLNSVFC